MPEERSYRLPSNPQRQEAQLPSRTRERPLAKRYEPPVPEKGGHAKKRALSLLARFRSIRSAPLVGACASLAVQRASAQPNGKAGTLSCAGLLVFEPTLEWIRVY